MTSDYKSRPLASHGSWTVVFSPHGPPKMMNSGWIVGYTPAHKETKIEALQYAIERTNQDIEMLKARNSTLADMVLEERIRIEVERTDG